MDRSLILRAGGLYLPITAAALLWYWRRPNRAGCAGLLLATLWNFEVLSFISFCAPRMGWWSFQARGGLFLGTPVDLLLGWAVLWGVVAVLAFPEAPVVFVALFFLLVDLVFMPQLAPLLVLRNRWLAGETVAIVLALLPSLVLARWTRNGVHLYLRAGMQALAFSGLTLGLLPAAILAKTHGGWEHVFQRPFWMNALLLQLVAPIAILGLSAVQEFAVRGGGTPLPYDPPRRLVTSGVYAYVANPMQLSAALLLAAWGWFLGSWWVAAAGGMAHIYSVGLASWDEKDDVSARFGPAWEHYRREVRAWIPRWRPWHPSLADPDVPRAKLYVAEGCGPCSEVKRWFESRGVIGLEVVVAETYPCGDLVRVTYCAADSREPDGNGIESGVAALARGLEHLHFGWVLVGCAVRLPGVCWLLQLLADASGSGPKKIVSRVAHSDRSLA